MGEAMERVYSGCLCYDQPRENRIYYIMTCTLKMEVCTAMISLLSRLYVKSLKKNNVFKEGKLKKKLY